MHPIRVLPAIAILLAAPAAANVFVDMDANNNGTVSSSEYEAYASATFGRIDRNGDGLLVLDEIHAFVGMGGGRAAGPSRLSAATRIQRRDLDGNGQITRAEYSQAAASRFQELDADHNNELTERELAVGY